MAELVQKKPRNHELDFWKMIACLLVLIFHCNQFLYGAEDPMWPYGYFGQSDLLYEEGKFMLKGVYSLGFFYFTTGYWLMNAFQGYKKKGLLRKGHDFEIAYRLTAKNYVAYMPICFMASLLCFIYGHATVGSDITTIFKTFVHSIWEFLGVDGLGMYGTPGKGATGTPLVGFLLSGAEAFDPNAHYSWAVITWYMTALICFCSVFFVLLIMNEKLVVFGVAPLLLASSLVTIDATDPPQGLLSILPFNFTKLWGPAMFGLVCWYAVEAIRKMNWSSKAKTLVGWLHCAMFIFTFVMIVVGYPGGMINFDVWLSILAGLTLIGKDWFTEAFNKLFEKLPFITKHWGDFSLGVFALQCIYLPLGFKFLQLGLVSDKYGMYWSGILAGCVGGIIWSALAPFVIKPMSKFLSKILGLNKPFGTMTVINDLEVKAE